MRFAVLLAAAAPAANMSKEAIDLEEKMAQIKDGTWQKKWEKKKQEDELSKKADKLNKEMEKKDEKEAEEKKEKAKKL